MDTSSLPFLLALALQSPPATDPPSVAAPTLLERRGAVFRLRYHGVEETPAAVAQAEAALKLVERTWPIATRLLGADPKPPAAPLTVNLHRTIAGYEAAEQALTGGKFRRNLAMTAHADGSAHVALQPPCSDETLRAVGLPGLTLALLAWEATHVVRMHHCANHLGHPMWLVDGLASSVAREAMGAELTLPGFAIPQFAKHQQRSLDLATARKLPPLAEVLGDRIDELDLPERYAVRATAFAFLASDARATRLGALLKQARQLGDGDGLAAEIGRLALKSFGDQGKAFERHVAALQPEWDEDSRSLLPRGKEWVQVAFPGTNAVAWRREPIKGGIAASGAVRILPADGRQLNFLFGRSGGDFFSLALVADVGWTLFDHHAEDDRWERFASEHVPALRLGYQSTFALTATGSTLELRLDDQKWAVALPRPFPAESQWGLGAQAATQGERATGSAGIWSALDVKAAKGR
ncbi:MAG: hypothetical protein FJ293_00850 [Planctomycetes bacterium]|nr:hypothetical protein [Planctomycetota bacterium]